MKARLGRSGRLVIPKSIRDALGLREGSVVEVRRRGDRIILSTRHEHLDRAAGDGVLVYSGAATGDLERAVEANRRARISELAGPASE